MKEIDSYLSLGSLLNKYLSNIDPSTILILLSQDIG